MILDDLADHLATAVPTIGLIVKGTMPATPHVGLSLMEYGGSAPDLGFGMQGIKHEHASVQLMTRGAPDDYDEPRTRIESAFQALSKIQGLTINGVFYLLVKPKQSPYLFARDDSKRVRFVVNFSVDKEPS